MVTFTAADDRRQSYKANQSRRAVNAARQHKATFGDPNWIMSQSPETMKNRDFMRKAKPAMVAVQGNRDFLTTDQDEERNLYQMWINQMKGGDKGARMLDTRGLPAGARRIGRTLFTDPAKSQGFFGDVGSLFTGKNKAAVRAKEYNPFPKAGFGEQFYKDQFPFASSFGNLMGLAEKSPTLSMLTSLFPKKERIPLEQDLSWVPEGVGEYDELPMMEFEDELDIEDLSYEPETVWGPEGDPSIGMAGMEEYIPEWTGWNEEWGTDDLTQYDGEDITENLEEIIEGPAETTETFTDLGDTHEFTEEMGWASGDYVDVQEYVNSIIQDPDNPYYEMDQDEFVEILIKQNRIKEK
jgi:hypothetical protein